MRTVTRPRYDKGQLLWPVTGGSIPMPVYLYKGLRRKGWRIKVVGTTQEHGEVLAFAITAKFLGGLEPSTHEYSLTWTSYTSPIPGPAALAYLCEPEDAPLRLACWDYPGHKLGLDILDLKINQGLPT